MKPTRSLPAKLIFFTLAILGLGILVGSLVRVEVLIVESNHNGSFKFRAPRVITIEYTHSVERGEVVETLEASGGCISLVSLEWQGYGAGMPSSLGDIEGVLEVGEGSYRVKVDKCLGRAITVNLNYMENGALSINGLHFTSGLYKLKLKEETLLKNLLGEIRRVLSDVFK